MRSTCRRACSPSGRASTTGRSSPIPSRGSPAASATCRAAARSAAPRRRTRWSTSAATAPTTTGGRRSGHEGWGWDDVLPYFIRAEDNERGASELHGAGGPLSVIENRSRYRTCAAFIEAGAAGRAAAQRGLQRPRAGRRRLVSGDPAQRPALLGGGRLPAPGARAAEPRPSRPDAHVTRLLLDGTRAIGVEIDQRDELREIRAEREVILSAGAYAEPADPAAERRSARRPTSSSPAIPCVHELPVGQGLQDHLATWITYTTDEPSLLTAETEENLGLLQTEGRGPLTSNFAESGGFFRTRRRPRGAGHPVARDPDPVPRGGRRRDPGRRLGAVGVPAASDEQRLRQAALPDARPPSRGSSTTTSSATRTARR